MHALARSQSSWQRATVRPFLALEPLGRPSQTDILFSLAASQRETVRRIISDDVADRLGSVWGADAQGEIPGVWVRPARLPSSLALGLTSPSCAQRYSGVPRFWLQSGNLFQARCYRCVSLELDFLAAQEADLALLLPLPLSTSAASTSLSRSR